MNPTQGPYGGSVRNVRGGHLSILDQVRFEQAAHSPLRDKIFPTKKSPEKDSRQVCGSMADYTNSE